MAEKVKKQKKRWDTFKSKYLGRVAKIAEWIVNIAGLILSIVSFIKNEVELGWKIVLGLIVFNSIFISFVSIYETLLYKRGASIESEIIEEKDKESRKLQMSQQLSDKLRYYYKYIISTYGVFTTKLYDVNLKHQESKENAQKIETACAGTMQDDTKTSVDYFKENAEEGYKQLMNELFNRFLSNITAKLKEVLDTHLKEKGCMLETSISVKQFKAKTQRPMLPDDYDVFTMFRDSQTYSQRKREVGEALYSISKNTDFLHCLSYPYYLKNNIKSDDVTYNNEHEGFSAYYNCAIVVPIKREYSDTVCYYGYLTCDILNDDLSRNDLLDDKMADVMEATANIMGMYYDEMNCNWIEELNCSFVDIICKKKIKSSLGPSK